MEKSKNRIKKTLITILKATRKQFYDEDNNPCSVEQYVDIVLSYPLEDILKFQKELEAKKINKRY